MARRTRGVACQLSTQKALPLLKASTDGTKCRFESPHGKNHFFSPPRLRQIPRGKWPRSPAPKYPRLLREPPPPPPLYTFFYILFLNPSNNPYSNKKSRRSSAPFYRLLLLRQMFISSASRINSSRKSGCARLIIPSALSQVDLPLQLKMPYSVQI